LDAISANGFGSCWSVRVVSIFQLTGIAATTGNILAHIVFATKVALLATDKFSISTDGIAFGYYSVVWCAVVSVSLFALLAPC
jgi:hypothetical protein